MFEHDIYVWGDMCGSQRAFIWVLGIKQRPPACKANFYWLSPTHTPTPNPFPHPPLFHPHPIHTPSPLPPHPIPTPSPRPPPSRDFILHGKQQLLSLFIPFNSLENGICISFLAALICCYCFGSCQFICLRQGLTLQGLYCGWLETHDPVSHGVKLQTCTTSPGLHFTFKK